MAFRFQVAARDTARPTRDEVVTTCYFEALGLIDTDELASDVADLFASYRPYPAGLDEIEVRVYDTETPPPNPPLSVEVSPITSNSGPSAPREVALCLSYRAGVASDTAGPGGGKRRRGRMYIGPWSVGEMSERPLLAAGGDPGDYLRILAEGLQEIGGVDIDWVQFSPSDDVGTPVTFWFVDDEWDTIRSRGLEPTTRISGTTSE